MKRILLVTSLYTGAGHKSISDSLLEQFSEMPGVEVQVIDGFGLMGKAGVRASRIYGVLTRRAPFVYNTAWRITMAHPSGFSAAARLCGRRFEECIRRFQPDLILTVHSLFNTVLTRMLKARGLDIPVVVLQADLVNIHSSWCNPEAYMTICPTQEAYEASLAQGMPPEKLKVLGFPVRGRICDAAREAGPWEDAAAQPLRCLLMSGGEGSGSLRAYAASVLENTDAELTVICGRNKRLYRSLLKSLVPKYGERVRVLGFVPDVEREMLRSDLLITRGSPNTLYEAVVMNVPLIITGPLPEQERDNPRLLQEKDLGVVSRSPDDVPAIIRSLLEDRSARLLKIRAAQRAWRSFDEARRIAEYAAELAGAPERPLS